MWSDAEDAIRPEHPRPAGLAHDRSWSRAVLTGLSDRLGWEARLAFERGETLATIDGIGPSGSATVYDGGLGHDLPCVLIVSDKVIRWGAGSTVESAYRRALYGDQGLSEDEVARELADMQLVLADAGVDIAVVDLGTTMLRQRRLRPGVGPAHGTLTSRWDADTSRYGRGTRPRLTDLRGGGGESSRSPDVDGVKLSARPSHRR